MNFFSRIVSRRWESRFELRISANIKNRGEDIFHAWIWFSTYYTWGNSDSHIFVNHEENTCLSTSRFQVWSLRRKKKFFDSWWKKWGDQEQKWKSVFQWSPGWRDKQQQQGTLSIMALSSKDCSLLDESSYICGLLTIPKEIYGLNLVDLLDFGILEVGSLPSPRWPYSVHVRLPRRVLRPWKDGPSRGKHKLRLVSLQPRAGSNFLKTDKIFQQKKKVRIKKKNSSQQKKQKQDTQVVGDTSPMIPNWPWVWPCWKWTTSYKFSVSVKKIGEGWTGGASDIVTSKSKEFWRRSQGNWRPRF